jgi:transposase
MLNPLSLATIRSRPPLHRRVLDVAVAVRHDAPALADVVHVARRLGCGRSSGYVVRATRAFALLAVALDGERVIGEDDVADGATDGYPSSGSGVIIVRGNNSSTKLYPKRLVSLIALEMGGFR